MNRRGFLSACIQGASLALATTVCPGILKRAKVVEETPMRMAFKGTGLAEAGYVWCPYQPVYGMPVCAVCMQTECDPLTCRQAPRVTSVSELREGDVFSFVGVPDKRHYVVRVDNAEWDDCLAITCSMDLVLKQHRDCLVAIYTRKPDPNMGFIDASFVYDPHTLARMKERYASKSVDPDLFTKIKLSKP